MLILGGVAAYVGAIMLLYLDNDWYGALGWFIAGSYMFDHAVG